MILKIKNGKYKNKIKILSYGVTALTFSHK